MVSTSPTARPRCSADESRVSILGDAHDVELLAHQDIPTPSRIALELACTAGVQSAESDAPGPDEGIETHVPSGRRPIRDRHTKVDHWSQSRSIAALRDADIDPAQRRALRSGPRQTTRSSPSKRTASGASLTSSVWATGYQAVRKTSRCTNRVIFDPFKPQTTDKFSRPDQWSDQSDHNPTLQRSINLNSADRDLVQSRSSTIDCSTASRCCSVDERTAAASRVENALGNVQVRCA